MRFSSRALTPLLENSSLGKEIRFPSRICRASSLNISTLETIILQPRSFPSSQEYCQECVDRTNLQATITNESREAAPRLRHHGVSAHGLTHVSVHWQRCLQGFQIPVLIPTSRPAPVLAARTDGDRRKSTDGDPWPVPARTTTITVVPQYGKPGSGHTASRSH